MTEPVAVRIQLRRTRGWRKPEGAVVVARPSPWGNPFKVGMLIVDPGWHSTLPVRYDGPSPAGTALAGGRIVRRVRDRRDAVALFRDYVVFHDDEWGPETMREYLTGRDLACWCPLDQPCHADVLLELSNSVSTP